MGRIPAARIVAVFAELATGKTNVGSGYLLDARHVLTARHCVYDKPTRPAGALRIRRASDGASAAVIVRHASLALDVALLEVTGDPPWGPDLPGGPVTFGKVDREHTGLLSDCQVAGYPQWQVDENGGHRDIAELHGTIAQMEGKEKQRLVLRDDRLERVGGGSGDRAWHGLSGAAVFYEGLLLGVVIEHRPRQGPAAVQIRPIEAIEAATDEDTVQLGTALGLAEPDAFRHVGPEPPGVIDFPYRGLMTYEQDDGAVFRGRQSATTEILRRLSRQLDEPGLLMVSGVSGVGKSSLLRAGVLFRVARGDLADAPGLGRWPSVVITPSRKPLNDLADGVGERAETDSVALRRELDADPEAILTAVRKAARLQAGKGATEGNAAAAGKQGKPRLLIVIDQFERIFTECDDEGERQAFIAALYAAATTRDGNSRVPSALVIVVVRADFEAGCAEYKELAEAAQDRYLLPPMTEFQLREAITEPAKRAGSSVDNELVEAILTEARSRAPGSPAGPEGTRAGLLPLLSYALDLAWRAREGDTLTLADYERVGGIESALSGAADRTYQGLTPSQQQAAKETFLRLITTTRGGLDTLSPVTRGDLTRDKRAAESEDVEKVLEAFSEARLITLGDSVEIAHEALLRTWDEFRKWRAGGELARVRHGMLLDDARVWEKYGEKPSDLYSAAKLAELRTAKKEWDANRVRYPLDDPADKFWRLSGAAARRARSRRHGLISAGAVLVLLAAAAGGLAWHFNGNAGQQHAIALSQQAIALSRHLASASTSLDASDPVTARRLALAAWSVYPTSEATTAVTTELAEQVRDGYLPADPAHSGVVTTGLLGGVSGVAFSPDGRLVATGGADVRLWDPADGKPAGVPLAVEGSGSTGVAFSPDGRLIASADAAGDVQVWNATSGRLDLDLHSDSAATATTLVYREAVGEEVAFSRDGRFVASGGSDGYARIWDVATGTPAGHPIAVDPPAGSQAGVDPGVTAVAFSPDSGLLATAGGSGYVRFWNPQTGAPAGAPLLSDPGQTTGSGGVVAIAFSHDGSLLATAGHFGQVRVWTVATRSLVAGPVSDSSGVVKGGQASCSSLAFSADGTLLACAGFGSAQLFKARTGTMISDLFEPEINPGVSTSVNVVAFSPRADLLATGSTSGVATLWNATAGTQGGTTVGAEVYPAASQLHAEGVLLASGDTLITGSGSDGYAQLAGPALPAAGGQGAWGITGETFSPDGRLLAVLAGQDLRLLDARTGKPWRQPIVAAPGQHDQLAAAVFSPRDDLVATLDTQGRGQLWNTTTGASIGQPFAVGPEYDVQQFMAGRAVAFSPDERLLAVAGLDGNVQLLSTATGDRVSESVTASPRPGGSAVPGGAAPPVSVDGSIGSVAFSATGRLLASASADGYVRLWNPVTGAQAGSPIAVDPASQDSASRGIAALAFSPDGRYLATVDGNGEIRLWDTGKRAAAGLPFAADTLTDGYGRPFTPASVAFSADGSVLVSVSQFGGGIEAWPTWLLTDPHAALCAQVGPPTAGEWAQYAPGDPEPDMCGPQR